MKRFELPRSAPLQLRRWALLLLAVGLALGACAPFHATAPEGFARFEQQRPFRAVTPDEVIYRVRQADNDPPADLTFWRKALKQRMTDAGYVFVSEQDLKASGVPGYLLELAAPFGQQDYSYLLAVFVRGDDLVIAEASGEVSRVRERRSAIVGAIERLRW